MHRIAIEREKLRQEVRDFWARCASAETRFNRDVSRYIVDKRADVTYREGAAHLYSMLVAPAEDELKGASTLVVVPHDVTTILPFAALIGPDNRHLIERFPISYAPSMTALANMLDGTSRRNLRITPGNGNAIGIEGSK